MHLGHGSSDLLAGANPAKAPAGHCPGLREAVGNDGLIRELGIGCREALVARLVAELSVNVVANHVEVAGARHLGNGIHAVAIEDAAGGVVGRGNHNRLGAGRDCPRKRLRVYLEVVRCCVERHRHAAGQPHKGVVEEKRRRRYDHLVAWVEKRRDGTEERLRCPVGHDDVVGREEHAALGLPRTDCLAKPGEAVVGWIVREAAVEVLPHPGAHLGRRVLAGLAQREGNAVGSLRGKGREAPDARESEAIEGRVEREGHWFLLGIPGCPNDGSGGGARARLPED